MEREGEREGGRQAGRQADKIRLQLNSDHDNKCE